MKRATCFFCYAWANDDRYEVLNFIKDKLEEKSDYQIDVIFDKRSYKDNDNFDEKLAELRTYDLIAVFFTPDLKEILSNSEKINNRTREILKEYKIIIERYEEDPHSVYPVILSGTKENALPSEFFRVNTPMVANLFVQNSKKSNKLIVPRNKIAEFNNFLLHIINRVRYNYINKTEEYTNTRDALNNLFRLTNNTDIPPRCLIKTDIYDYILNQECYFVVGRKGSGKSTFINNFREMDRDLFDKKYKQMIPITAESFHHEEAYDTLIKRHINDRTLMSTHDLLILFWKVYLTLQSVLTVGYELEIGNIDYSDPRHEIFEKVSRKLKRKIGLYVNKRYRTFRSDRVPNLIFEASIELVDERFVESIKLLKNEELVLTSFCARMDADQILENFFGIKNLRKFLEALRQCKKTIVISLDCFDTNSEDFRKSTTAMDHLSDEYQYRSEYEMLFFRTLIEVVTNFKEFRYNDMVMSTLSQYLDFCIVLPKDRYDQIKENDRDIFKKTFRALTWDAYELIELLVKRLEYLITVIDPNQKIDASGDLFKRMDKALDYFPGLPKTVTIDVDGNSLKMGLLEYILRYSFWRPRDVISNLSVLMSYAVSVDMHDPNKVEVFDSPKLYNEGWKLVIKDNASKIINEEFIEEYKNVFRNLDEVLYELEESPVIVCPDDFKNKLSKIQFDASFAYDLNDVTQKMLVLYQLGVIGLIFDKNVARMRSYQHHICFLFNAGMNPFYDFIKNKSDRYGTIKIVINPIFSHKLLLDFNTKELIGNWDREYIIRSHSMKSTIQSI